MSSWVKRRKDSLSRAQSVNETSDRSLLPLAFKNKHPNYLNDNHNPTPSSTADEHNDKENNSNNEPIPASKKKSKSGELRSIDSPRKQQNGLKQTSDPNSDDLENNMADENFGQVKGSKISQSGGRKKSTAQTNGRHKKSKHPAFASTPPQDPKIVTQTNSGSASPQPTQPNRNTKPSKKICSAPESLRDPQSASNSPKYSRKSVSITSPSDFVCWDGDVYPFSSEDSDENILLDQDKLKEDPDHPVVKAGTLEKLVERLTYPIYSDPEMMNTFLITYRTFTTPTDFLSLLVARYGAPQKECPTKQEQEEWEQQIKHIRFRVCCTLQAWLKGFSYDFVEDEDLLDSLKQFIAYLDSVNENTVSQLNKYVERLEGMVTSTPELPQNNPTPQFGFAPPTPVLPRDLKHININTISPLEIARQLTIIEQKLYKAIQVNECVGQPWANKASREKKAPNIMAMITRFNQVSRWVAMEILKVESLKKRGQMLNRMIDIAIECEKLNNYNAMMEIVSGLQCTSIYRLRHTWPLVSKTNKRKFDEIQERMTRHGNFKNFREHLHAIDPPCIPYLGVYLTDLTFIEDGNKDYLEEHNLINFSKRQKVAKVIREIQQYQQSPYCLLPVPELQEWLENVEFWDENEMFERSLQLEPKGQPPAKLSKKKKEPRKTKAKPKKVIEEDTSREVEGEEDWGELEFAKNYPFTEPDSKDNIIFDVDVSSLFGCDGSPSVKAATLIKLIERLTHDNWPDPTLVSTFLLTYPAFSSKNEVLNLLHMRFNIPKPLSKDEDLQQRYYTNKIMPVRFRVFNVLKTWVDKYFYGCVDDEAFVQKFILLADSLKQAKNMEKAGEALKASIERRLTGKEEVPERRKLGTPPPPHMPRVMSNPTLLDFHLEEIARQLTLIDQKLLLEIKPWELLVNSWKNNEIENAPNIAAILERSEKVKLWVLTSIVSRGSVEEATEYLVAWIKIAQKCLDLNNFHGMVQIVSGLMAPEITRLKLLQNLSAKATYNKLKTLVQGNFSKLQDKLHNVQPPCVPYLGAYLDIIKEIDNKYADRLGALINFEKYTLIATTIAEFCTYQQSIYNLEEVEYIQSWMEKVEVLSKEEILENAKILLTRPSTKPARSPTTVSGLIRQESALRALTRQQSKKSMGLNKMASLFTNVGEEGSKSQIHGKRKKNKDLSTSFENLDIKEQFEKRKKTSLSSERRSSGEKRGSGEKRDKRPSGEKRSPGEKRFSERSGRASGEIKRRGSSNSDSERSSGEKLKRSSGSTYRKSRSSSEEFLDSQSQLSCMMLQIFLDNAKFRNEVKELLLDEISKELLEFKSSIHSDIADLTKQISAMNETTKITFPMSDETKKQIICDHFGSGKSVSLWTGNDQDGKVLGWPEDITIHTVIESTGVALVDVVQSVTRHEVANLLRVALFYKDYNRKKSEPKVYIFSPTITKEVKYLLKSKPTVEFVKLN